MKSSTRRGQKKSPTGDNGQRIKASQPNRQRGASEDTRAIAARLSGVAIEAERLKLVFSNPKLGEVGEVFQRLCTAMVNISRAEEPTAKHLGAVGVLVAMAHAGTEAINAEVAISKVEKK